GGSDTRTVEIDVLSTIPADGNVALGRAAIQSATDGGAIASRAVDGNSSGDFSLDSVAQTISTLTPLWEVDLGAVYDIGTIELYLRDDGVNLLNNYYVLVSENPFSSGNLNAALTDPGVWYYQDAGTADLLESITVGVLGRYVRVQMAGVDDVLALAEVKVISA
ncbi:MAG: hypothetical protein HKN47_09850, partial [Pirellulaceae bacterium]|nr:hypothetical protein [Pirellulaceae bacterium]